MHLHISLIHAFATFLEVLLALIPVKIVAAWFSGRSALADAALHVL